MQISALFVVAALSVSAFANPVHMSQRQAINLNQGSDRQITQTGTNEFTVDPGIVCANGDLASQVACLLDEKDCKDAGKGDAECTQARIGCQSGNGINGQSAKLNNESP